MTEPAQQYPWKLHEFTRVGDWNDMPGKTRREAQFAIAHNRARHPGCREWKWEVIDVSETKDTPNGVRIRRVA